MKKINLWALFFFNTLLQMGGCVTSGDVVQKNYKDPTQVAEEPKDAEVTPARTATNNENAEELQRQIAILKGELETQQHFSSQKELELQKKLADLEAKNKALAEQVAQGTTVAVAPKSTKKTSEGADALWKISVEDVNKGNFAEAAGSLQEFVKNYPKNKKILIAQIAIGHCYYNLKQYEDALLAYNKVIDVYPKNNSAAIAWYGGGLSLLASNKASDAKLFFEELQSRFPDSPQAKASKSLGPKSKLPANLFEHFGKWWARATESK